MIEFSVYPSISISNGFSWVFVWVNVFETPKQTIFEKKKRISKIRTCWKKTYILFSGTLWTPRAHAYVDDSSPKSSKALKLSFTADSANYKRRLVNKL